VAATLLVLVLSARGGEGAVATSSPTPSPATATATATVSPSSLPSSSGSPSARPSPSPTPAGPAQAALVQGWTRVEVGLNLRDGPGASSAIVTTLHPGDVLWVNSEANPSGGQDWYFAMTLNDTQGWIASGPADDPFATTLSNRFVFTSCGPVQLAGKVGVVNGLRTVRLDSIERAAFELGQSTETRSCIRYRFEDYEPGSRMDLVVHACGAPSWDGSTMRLGPTTAGDVIDTWRVAAEVNVPDVLLAQGAVKDAEGLTNRQKVLILGSRLSSPIACVSAEVIRRISSQPYDDKRYDLTAQTAGCMVMLEKIPGTVRFAPAAGGDPVSFVRSHGDDFGDLALNDSRLLSLTSARGRYSLERLRADVLADC